LGHQNWTQYSRCNRNSADTEYVALGAKINSIIKDGLELENWILNSELGKFEPEFKYPDLCSRGHISEDSEDMTKKQMALEKISLQKCLLYFESIHGRPVLPSKDTS
ncbi:unnamed protein product, partial [Eretmochelys imbricata]